MMEEETEDIGLWDWMKEYGPLVEPMLLEQWKGKSKDDWMAKANTIFPADKTSDQDEIRKSMRMAYWTKMIDHECMMDLIQLEPFSFITTPDEMELVYTMGRLNCLVPSQIQRIVWCEEHMEGREPVKPITSAMIVPSPDDSYTTLLSNLDNWTPVSDSVTHTKLKSANGVTSKKGHNKDKRGKPHKATSAPRPSEWTSAEAQELIRVKAKKSATPSQAKEVRAPSQPVETPKQSIKPTPPVVQKTKANSAGKKQFTSYVDHDDDHDKEKIEDKTKSDATYQTSPLIYLAQEFCKHSKKSVSDIMENIQKEVPKLSTARYAISTDDVLGIRKEASQRTMKQNRECERWALDALDCAISIDSSFTINDFIHMLPEEISFKEAGDLITRARANLAVLKLIDRKRKPTDTLDVYTDPVLEIISKGSILSAIHSAKNTIEPTVAAIMGRLLATEADQVQNFKDLEKILDNVTASNSTTINATTNLYKSFVAWTKKLHGKDDVTAGDLLTGASEHGKGTIDDMFAEARAHDVDQDLSSESSDDGTANEYPRATNKQGIVARSIYDD